MVSAIPKLPTPGILPLGRWLMVVVVVFLVVVFLVVAFVKMTDGMGMSHSDSDSDVSSDLLSLFLWMDRMNASVCSNAVNDVKGTD